MCDGSTPVDVPLATTRTTQVAITYQDTGIFGTAQKWPDPITVTGALNVTGADAIILQDHSTNGFFTTLPQGYTSITNTGSITSTGGYGINNQSTLTTLTNNGTIVGGGTGATGSIMNTGTIATLANMGTIGTGLDFSVINSGDINLLNNLQGAGNAAGALSISGKLPLAYNIIINDLTNYGQLNVTAASGPMQFGINSSSVVLRNSTYMDVLRGVSNINLYTGITGNFDGQSYSLVADTNNAGNYNLVFASGGVAPEMNASHIPQVALLISCMFLMFGRRRECH